MQPSAAAAPLSGSSSTAIWIALLAAFADTQFVQWTSFSMRPAMIAFSWALDMALFLGLAALLTVAVHLVGGSRRASALTFPVVSCGVAALWLFSRAQLAALQSVGPDSVFFWLPSVVVLVVILTLASKGGRQPAPAAVVWTGAALVWLVYTSRATAADPLVATTLVLVGTGINTWWVMSSYASRPRSRTAGFAVLNALVLIASFPLAPGFDRPSRRPAATDNQATQSAPGAADRTPHVIVIVLDTVRADHMSTYGYEYDTTPQLDAFAATATLFEPAITNATWSLPSHASLLTGLLPHQHGAHAALTARRRPSGGSAERSQAEHFSFAQRPLSADHETMAELLAARGYSTAAIVANFGWISEFFGLLQGFHYVDNRPMNLFNWEPVAAPYLRRLGWDWLNDRYILINKSAFFADSIVAHTREWEAQRPPGPFFLLLNFMDAHAPFRASLMTDEFSGRLPDLARERGKRSSSVARYDRSVAYLDAEVGKFFDFLRSRDLFNDSLIVVTSDHGENFDEDRPAHGADLLQATLSVPLIIKSPGQ